MHLDTMRTWGRRTDNRPLSSVHMDPIQFGSNLSHKHYRGRKHIAHRALCPLRPEGASAPACSENVVQHQSNNSCKRARLGARQEARILAFTPHPLLLAPAARPFVCTTRSLPAPINLLPAHSPAAAQFKSHSLSETLRQSSRPSPRPRATRTTLAPISRRPAALPSTVPRSFPLFSPQHRAWCSCRRHISSRPAVASGVSRTKCGEVRERLLGPRRALGRTGGHHGPTTTNRVILVVKALRHKHCWGPRAVWEVRGQLAGRESSSIASRH
jgi:hypothetical protein